MFCKFIKIFFPTHHHLAAKATWYLPSVLVWTVRTLTIREIVAKRPTKSSSIWVPNATGFRLGRSWRFCTSSGYKISPNR